MKLSVLQWNVLYKEAAENILKLIREVDADIVCLQELTRDSDMNPKIDIPALIEALGYQSHYFVTLTEESFVMGDGIFSKYHIISRAVEYTHRGKDLPNYDNAYADEPRAYLEAKVNLDEKNLTIGTTHLSYSPRFIPNPARQKEDEKFVSLVSNNHKRFVFTGDFNALPEGKLVQTLLGQFRHAGPNFSRKTWTTKPFTYDGFEANTLDWRLDYVFVTPDIKVLSSKIIQTDYSDHLPVLTTLEI